MKRSFRLFVLLTALLFSAGAGAQHLLEKKISLDVRNQPVEQVLQRIGKQGGFDFSYSNPELAALRPVTLSVRNQSVRQVLDEIFRGTFSYRETRRHLILRAGGEKYFTVSGYVVDASTGERLPDCTVYDGDQLASALSDREGYFRLRMRSRTAATTLRVSKDLFNEESIALRGGFDQQVSVSLQPAPPLELPEYELRPAVEKTWLGRLALGSKLRAQSANLGKFFASKPYQASFIPGIGTHGRMGGQVVNKFSFNALGGYSGGSSGFEIAGIFNIDKQDVNAAQIGGVFNIVGGEVNGLQIGGVYNNVLDSVSGVQIGGVANVVDGSVEGVQIAGIGNVVSRSARGFQLAGIHNYAARGASGAQIAGISNLSMGGMKGFQLAGICNIVRGDMEGTQVAGIVNHARVVRGTQVGLINIADSATGYALGLFNVIRHGYHQLSVYGTEVLPVNVALKTGTHRFYSMLLGGASFAAGRRAYAFGFGVGTDLYLGRHWRFSLEGTAQHLYLGNWDALNLTCRLQPALQWAPTRWLRLFGGPALTAMYRSQLLHQEGYLQDFSGSYTKRAAGGRCSAWLGWQAGVSFF